jgi:hypothetical protein
MEPAMRIGITGHMNLTSDTVPIIARAIREHLAQQPSAGLIGISCLAQGADTLFGQAVLDRGGALEVIQPSADYRRTRVKPDHAPEFDRLLAQAVKVCTMPYDTADNDAYTAANNAILDTADHLVAVWDGKPAAGKGGTATVVHDARERGLPVAVIWPDGASREM